MEVVKFKRVPGIINVVIVRERDKSIHVYKGRLPEFRIKCKEGDTY